MLARPGLRKPEHPLADRAAAAQVLGELTQSDPISCLQGLAELLDKLKTAGRLDLSRSYEIADQIDRAGRPCWRRAARDYHDSKGKRTDFQANRIWVAVGEYLVQLAEAYELCLGGFDAGVEGAAGLRGQVLRLVARAIRLRVAAQSWDYVRYAHQFGRWAAVYRLYQLAEARGWANEKVVLYRGGRLSTVEHELMQAVMLAVAAPHGMLPEQIDIADRVTARLAQYFALTFRGSADRPYYFDPASADPPARELPGIRPPITARRFGPGDAEAELHKLAQRARAGEPLLREIGVDQLSERLVLPTLEHLMRYWCATPPERRHLRRRDAKRIVVVHGFDEVMAKVGNVPSAYPFVSSQESWLVDNSAEGGLGAIAASTQGAWAGIGSLLAYRYPEDGAWNAGIVRHVTDEEDGRFLGIELLSPGGIAVTLRKVGTRQAPNAQGFLGVWLAGRTADEIKLLMPAGSHSARVSLEMHLHDRQYLLTPGVLMEAGPDYEVAFYNPVAGSQAR
jgi:hypothetical protein